MRSLSGRLLRLAVSLQEVKSLLNEDISVSPHHFPGILTNTMGGPAPKGKKHQVHLIVGPRGIASAEDDENEGDDGDE